MSSVTPPQVIENFDEAAGELRALAAHMGWNFERGEIYTPHAHPFKADGLDIHTPDGDRYDLNKLGEHDFYAQPCKIVHPEDKTSGGYPVTLKVDLLCATKDGKIVNSSAEIDCIQRTAVHFRTRPEMRAAVNGAFATKWMYV